jgi:vitamin B12 transporter
MLNAQSRALALIVPALTIHAIPAAAQESIPLEGIDITASRFPEQAGKVGSAVTVLDRRQIEAARAENVAELLETVPGLTVNQAGGVGGTASVSIRGADPDQTLVLIDGIRVNDPASTGSEFDFSVFSLGNVERIEVLRGPQSGLYGSDAVGGVINIIMRKGEGEPRAVVEAEAGSYNTFAQRAFASGSKDGFSASVAASNFRTSGFSRFSGGTEDDAARKRSINARLDYDDPSAVWGITVAAGRYEVDAELDSVGLSSGRDSADSTTKILQLASAAARLSLMDGALQNRLTAFFADSEREFFDDDGFAAGAATGLAGTSFFEGQSRGLEYQGDLTVRETDRLTLGGKLDQQSGTSFDVFDPVGLVPRYDVEESWRSAFAIYSFNPTDVLNLTGAVRLDEFGPVGTKSTYRLTAAWRFPEWGTKLRGSFGTGAKAPTIQQRFEESAFATGNPDLDVETSQGFDIGMDQELAGGAVMLSGTYFSNDIEELISTEFDAASGKFVFVNVDAAEIDGVELAGTWKAADWISFKGAYTFLHAIDAETGLALARRPEHAFNAKVIVQPMVRLQLSASATYVGERFNRSNERDLIDDYVRVDLAGSYDLNADAELFFRADNVFDAEYEELKGFGTAGRSGYLGLRARF